MLQLLEGRLPEFEVQNLALAGQKIVFDVEPQHGFEMAAQHRGRDQLGNFGGLIAAVFDLVQRVVAQLLARCLLFVASLLVPLRGARVQVPAVVVDARWPSRSTLFKQRMNLGERLALEMQKSHHHIRNLHAGVVDVVLHVDFLPGGAQQAHKCVAEDGVAQMADVRGLVGIDAGVLDQSMEPALADARGLRRLATVAVPAARSRRALM